MPAVRDRDDGDAPEPTGVGRLGGDSDVVGFLDLPSLDTTALAEAIVDAFSRLATDAVLTVFSPSVDASDVVAVTAPHEIELVSRHRALGRHDVRSATDRTRSNHSMASAATRSSRKSSR